MSSRYEDDEEIEIAKRLERGETYDWCLEGLADNTDWWSLLLSEVKEKNKNRKIAVEDARYLSSRRFREVYEDGGRPLVIKGSGIIKNESEWSLDSFRAHYGELNWRLSDTHGAVVALEDWVQYGTTNFDDAPFGLYDSEILNDIPDLGAAYTRPSIFSQCDFGCLSAHERPPWRWILLGCPRSGTGLHIDPLLTHAWVHLVQGHKLWVMLPPGTGLVEPEPNRTPSANWFFQHRNRLKARTDYIEFVQNPGETVFIPAGYEHGVLNLDWTVALTENYAKLSHDTLLAVSSEEPSLYDTLLRLHFLFHTVLLDDYFLPRILFFLPTYDIVNLATVAQPFEKAALSSSEFWTNRIHSELLPAESGAAALAKRYSNKLPAARKQQLGSTTKTNNNEEAKKLRALYLDILESQEEERILTGQGLC